MLKQACYINCSSKCKRRVAKHPEVFQPNDSSEARVRAALMKPYAAAKLPPPCKPGTAGYMPATTTAGHGRPLAPKIKLPGSPGAASARPAGASGAAPVTANLASNAGGALAAATGLSWPSGGLIALPSMLAQSAGGLAAANSGSTAAGLPANKFSSAIGSESIRKYFAPVAQTASPRRS